MLRYFYILFFHTRSSKTSVYFTVCSPSQFGLATFPVLSSHTWLVAARLDSTGLVQHMGSGDRTSGSESWLCPYQLQDLRKSCFISLCIGFFPCKMEIIMLVVLWDCRDFFKRLISLSQYLVHLGCWVDVSCYSYYPKACPLRSTCLNSSFYRWGNWGPEFGRHWFQRQRH